jgi:hypothetical protein
LLLLLGWRCLLLAPCLLLLLWWRLLWLAAQLGSLLLLALLLLLASWLPTPTSSVVACCLAFRGPIHHSIALIINIIQQTQRQKVQGFLLLLLVHTLLQGLHPSLLRQLLLVAWP